MAVILVAGVGAWAGAGATGATAAIIATAVAAAAIGAAYIDQRYVYPALFGKDSPKNPSFLGLDAMTGDDGSPGHRAWGRSALVGGHVLFFENQINTSNRISSKKTGTGPVFTKRTADIGIGWAHNLIQSLEVVYADQKTFWRRDPNNVLWSDYRCDVTTTGGGTRVAITPTVGDAQDIGPVIFVTGDVVRITNMPVGPNGLWRVADSYPLGDPTYPYGRLELTPLEGQTPAAGDPGTPAVPMEVRRIDAAVVETFSGSGPTSPTLGVFNITGTQLWLLFLNDTLPHGAQESHFWRTPATTLRQGMRVRVTGASPSYANGIWDVAMVSYSGTVTSIHFDPVEGQSGSSSACSSPGGATNPIKIIAFGEEGFLEPSAEQEIVTYLGTEDEDQDPDLAAIFGSGNTHGYRGLARSTIRKFNLSNFGDRVPQCSGVVNVSARHTTHDVMRDVLLEAFDDDGKFSLDDLEPNPVIGYTRRGTQQGGTTLQPVAIAFGIESQDIGGTIRLFKPDAADVHVLDEIDLGAHRSGEKVAPRFKHQRIQDRDIPRRLSLFYRDPLNDFSRTSKVSRASAPDDQAGEDVAVDVDPLVLYPWDAQNAVNRLFAQALIGRDQGSITLPPSRMDILPNDRVTYTALNWNEEEVTLVDDAIDHQTAIADIEPYSVSIEVDFETAGGCRLVDDGSGFLVGHPDTVVAIANYVNYSTGEVDFVCGTELDRGVSSGAGTTTTLNDGTAGWTINEHAGATVLFTGVDYAEIVERSVIVSNTATQLTFSPATSVAYGAGAHYLIAIVDGDSDRILSARIRYEFPNPWRMRVQNVTSYRNRITELQVVAVAERFPFIGSPVQQNDPAYQLVVRPANIVSHVLDIAGVIDGFVQHPGVFLAAAPRPGSEWRGAGVYTSTDGISFSLLDYIEQPTTMGTATDHLLSSDVAVVDWSQSLTVVLDYGTLSDATLDQISGGWGTNWALYGDEILAFHSAVLNVDGTYTVTGFVRGLRDTADQIGTHADGERFVLLTALGVPSMSGQFHEFPMPTEVGRSVYVKVVPTGGVLDNYDSTQVTWQGENVRPFAPTSVVQGSLASYGYNVAVAPTTYDATEWLTADVVIRWFRRSRAVSPIFGSGAAAPLLEAFERYQVDISKDAAVVRSEIVGGANTGGTMVHRTFRYALADQVTDGFTSGDLATITVRQIGASGSGGYSRGGSISWVIP